MTKKATYSQVSEQMDKFFFLPFTEGETPEIRATSIDAYLESVGWTWDDVLNEMGKIEGN